MIQEYIHYQQAGRHLSLRTCEEYAKDLHYFAKWAATRGLRWSTIRTADLMAYQEACSHLEGTTVNKRLTALRSLFNWMMGQGMLSENPAACISSVRTHPKRRETATIEEYDQYLIEPCRSREEQDAKLLFAMLAETGCRIGEVINLTFENIDIDGLKFKVVGKGLKAREVYYSKRTAYMLQQVAESGRRTGRLFEEYGQRHFRFILSKYFDTDGQHIHPHKLRHTYATRMYHAGCPMKDLASLLGHSSQRTTERYLHISDDHRQQTYREYWS